MQLSRNRQSCTGADAINQFIKYGGLVFFMCAFILIIFLSYKEHMTVLLLWRDF